MVERHLAKVNVARSNRVTRLENQKVEGKKIVRKNLASGASQTKCSDGSGKFITEICEAQGKRLILLEDGCFLSLAPDRVLDPVKL